MKNKTRILVALCGAGIAANQASRAIDEFNHIVLERKTGKTGSNKSDRKRNRANRWR